MASLASAALSAATLPLTIFKCSVNRGIVTPDPTKYFAAMLNPNSYDRSYEIEYSDDDESFGALGSDKKFSRFKAQTQDFTIKLDGTGVVSNASSDALGMGMPSSSVTAQIDSLKGIVYQYDGSKHEPSVVQLVWGSLIYTSRLEKMNIKHTLFSPVGTPLRADVTLTLAEYLSSAEETLRANRSSPDLTHSIEVKAGDSLPLLCEKIYNDSSYYLAVAQANGLDHFRDIRPGQSLFFPPLD